LDGVVVAGLLDSPLVDELNVTFIKLGSGVEELRVVILVDLMVVPFVVLTVGMASALPLFTSAALN